MPELRFRFEKRGRAAYLSHLDVMRTFQRACIRAGIRVRHSEGFNPHPKMSIALPLQLGCESACELLDVSVLDGPCDMIAALNASLPEGIRVLSSSAGGSPVRNIAWTEWALTFPSPENAAEAERILHMPALPVEKKTKRGTSVLDIAPHIELNERVGNRMTILLRAGEPTVNTGDLAKALAEQLPAPPRMRSLRLRFLTADKEEFS